MFEEVWGLPTHALAVHAPLVLVPLLLLVALAYALVPKWGRYLGWLAVGLAVVAPLSAVLANLSGDAYRRLLYGSPPLDPELPVQVHAGHGTWAMWSSIGLGAVTLLLAAVRRGTESSSGLWRVVGWLLTVALVVLATVVAYYLIRTGHTGAEMVHGGRVSG